MSVPVLNILFLKIAAKVMDVINLHSQLEKVISVLFKVWLLESANDLLYLEFFEVRFVVCSAPDTFSFNFFARSKAVFFYDFHLFFFIRHQLHKYSESGVNVSFMFLKLHQIFI